MLGLALRAEVILTLAVHGLAFRTVAHLTFCPTPGRAPHGARAGAASQTPGSGACRSSRSTCARGRTPTRCSGYRLWQCKARAYLLGKRPQVGAVLDWAEKQLEPITESRQQTAAALAPGFDIAQISGMLCTTMQRTVSDQLRVTKPELAGHGLGLELWRLLVREHEAPEQPVVQRVPEALGVPEALRGRRRAPPQAPALGGTGP